MVYFDYAATSFIKPDCVYRSVYEAMCYNSANPGRGGHFASVQAAEKIYEAREKICKLFQIATPERLAFFPNTTQGLNVGIKGVLNHGDHVVISGMEHNSVARPIEALKHKGLITCTIVKPDKDGNMEPEQFVKAMNHNTKLVVCSHASNVCGNVYDIASIGRLVHQKEAYFMVDAAQSAGVIPICADDVDLLAFPGHKSLYGPQGSGGLYVREGIRLQTITEGGTGSSSELLTQPDEMPDRLESGTQNVPAIVGLGAAADFILDKGIDTISNHDKALCTRFKNGILNMPKITVYGNDTSVNVVALNIDDMDCVEVSERLDKEFGIATRSGLHCAVLAHKALGTLGTGCVRFSFGCFNTTKEVDYALDALYYLINH
ncbi:MAG: aminotransferase class V-fold PLP-dependent enzyme [Clostridia bacterium]|nr:aminotransferase class V-fold PLP-dependent enzyme [Clostridia bacterium]